jgi:hypothetical protein
LIYFIFCEAANAVKIGFAADPMRRLAMLQTGNPLPLVLLAAVQGGLKQEQRFHQRFRSHHIRGEWFRADSQLMAVIQRFKVEVPMTFTPGAGGKRLRPSVPRYSCICGRLNWNRSGYCADCGPAPSCDAKRGR